LRAELTGQRLSKEAALGIAGKAAPGRTSGIGLGGLAGLGTQVITQSVDAGQMMAAIPAVVGLYVWKITREMKANPKRIGTFWRRFGATERKVAQIEEAVSQVIDSAPADVVKRGLALGIMFDRIVSDEEEKPDEDLLTTLGASSPMFRRER
jgi:hypothetical protein